MYTVLGVFLSSYTACSPLELITCLDSDSSSSKYLGASLRLMFARGLSASIASISTLR